MAVLVLAIILVLPCQAAFAGWAPWASTRQFIGYFGVKPLHPDHWNQPAISGNIVAVERRDGDTGNSDVYAYDLRTGAGERCSTVSDGEQTEPEISGNWVVYTDTRHGDQEIYAYNVATNAERRITTKAGNQQTPDISGNLIVYRDGAGISVADLEGGTAQSIDAAGQYPSIWGRRVAYVKTAGPVVYRDLNDGSTHTVASGGVYANTEISGDYVAWQDAAAPTFDVYAFNIATGVKLPVSTGDGYGRAPEINGTRLVWYEEIAGIQRVWAFDLVQRKSVQLSIQDNYDLSRECSISGNNVVWTDTDDPSTVPPAHLGVRVVLASLRAPTLSLSASGPINYGATAKMSGRLAEDTIALGGKKVGIYKSTDGGHTWSKVKDVTTNSDGGFAASVALTRTTQFRAQYDGESEIFLSGLSRFSAQSAVKSVSVRVSLGKPSGPSAISEDKAFTTRGSLKPRHTGGTKPVRIVVYKKSKSTGKYVYKKTYFASVYDYDTYSRYKARITLTSRGRWRYRTYYPTSSTNYKTYSSWRYVVAE